MASGASGAQAAFVEAELSRLAGLKSERATLIHYRATQEDLLFAERRSQTRKWVSLAAALLTTVLCYVLGNVLRLKEKFPIAYSWYEGHKIKGATSAVGRERGTTAFGFRRGPTPTGVIHYSMWCVATADEYPALLTLLSLFGVCPTINRAGGIFLANFVQEFYNQVEGIHWSGSAAQLNAARGPEFLSSWAKWDVAANPWRWLFKSELELELSVAARAAREEWTGSYLESLYMGGLCRFALDQTSAASDPDQLMQNLLGIKLLFFVKCESNRQLQAYQNAQYAAMSTSAAVGLFYAGGKAKTTTTLRAVERFGPKSMAQKARVVLDRKAAEATVKQADKIAKFTQYATRDIQRGKWVRNSVGFAKRASTAAKALNKVGLVSSKNVELLQAARNAQNAAQAARTAAQATRTAAQATRAAAAGTEVAVGVTTEVAAETAANAGAAAACGSCLLACIICAALWELVTQVVITVVITMVASAAVGGVAGAVTYANSKPCKGQYYIRVDGKDVKWDGDLATLPKRSANRNADDADDADAPAR